MKHNNDRRQPDGLVAPGLTRLLLFQMCFALYAARDAHAMRHYDVKLLNFLLADFAACVASTTGPSRLGEDEAAAAAALFSPNSAAAAAMAAGRAAGGHGGGRKQLQLQQGGVMTVRYGLGPHVYRLEMPAEQVRRRRGWGWFGCPVSASCVYLVTGGIWPN